MDNLTLLENLNEADRIALSEHFQPFSLVAEGVLFYEGDRPDGLYLIEDGVVEEYFVFDAKRGASVEPVIKGKGDFLGEAIFLGLDSPSTSIIIEAVKGSKLSADKLTELKSTNPALILALTTSVFTRAHQKRNDLIHKLASIIDRHKALIEVSQGLNSPFLLDSLLHNIWVFAIQFTHSERCTIYVIDEEKGDLYSRVMYDEKVEEIRLPIGKGIAGHVALTGEVINIEDAYSSEFFNPEIDKKTGFHTKNILTVPMKNPEGKIIGALQVLNKKSGSFSKSDEGFLQAMGIHASLAIQRALLTQTMAQQESLAAIGNFAAGMIHDIKNPLTVIQGYSELLGMTHKDPTVKKYMDTIQSQIQRLLSMIQEVLDFSHGVIRVNKSENDVLQFIEKILETFIIKFEERGIELERRFVCETLKAVFDTDRLMRVAVNLITNSIEAMSDGGKIIIEIDSDDKEWYLTVHDSGVGIPADRLIKVFDKFHSHGKKNGTGLGLAITKQIVEAHGGAITVESEENIGTTFKVVLPVNPEEE